MGAGRPHHRGDQDRNARKGADRRLSGARHPAGRRRDALGRIKTRDPDEWAAAWSAVADSYMAKAQSGERSERGRRQFSARLAALLFRAVAGADLGRQTGGLPAGVDAYLLHAKYFDPPLEVVRIPFEGKEIVGYLRLPANAAAPGAAGAGDFGSGQPQGDGRRNLCGGAAGRHRLLCGRQSRHRTGAAQGGRDLRPDVFARARLSRHAAGDRQEPHPRAWPEFWRLLGGEARAHRGEAPCRRRHPIAADPPHLPAGLLPRPDVHPRISVRPACRRACSSTA